MSRLREEREDRGTGRCQRQSERSTHPRPRAEKDRSPRRRENQSGRRSRRRKERKEFNSRQQHRFRQRPLARHQGERASNTGNKERTPATARTRRKRRTTTKPMRISAVAIVIRNRSTKPRAAGATRAAAVSRPSARSHGMPPMPPPAASSQSPLQQSVLMPAAMISSRDGFPPDLPSPTPKNLSTTRRLDPPCQSRMEDLKSQISNCLQFALCYFHFAISPTSLFTLHSFPTPRLNFCLLPFAFLPFAFCTFCTFCTLHFALCILRPFTLYSSPFTLSPPHSPFPPDTK